MGVYGLCHEASVGDAGIAGRVFRQVDQTCTYMAMDIYVLINLLTIER